MRALRWIARSQGLTTVVALSLAAPALAATTDDFATLEAASGRVSVIRLGQQQPLAAEMPLQRNDVVVTSEGRATVRFSPTGRCSGSDQTPASRSTRRAQGAGRHRVLRPHLGPRRAVEGADDAVQLQQHHRGDPRHRADLRRGGERRRDAGCGSRGARGGQDRRRKPGAERAARSRSRRRGGAPSLSTQVRPQRRRAVGALLPPVVFPEAGRRRGAVPGQAKVRDSASEYAKGDLKRALESLAGVEAQGTSRIRGSSATALRSCSPPATSTTRAKRHRPGPGAGSERLRRARPAGDHGGRRQPGRQGPRDTAKRRSPPTRSRPRPDVAHSYARQAQFDLAGGPGESRNRGARSRPTTRWPGPGSPRSGRRSGTVLRPSRRRGRRSTSTRTSPGPSRCSGFPT